jgi:hypothetical protein
MGLRSLLTTDTNDTQAARLALLTDLASQVTHGLRNFARAGAALARIRDEKLYRLQTQTFEQYCLQTWQMSDEHARRLIQAADIAHQLADFPKTPTNEHQARQLASVPKDKRPEAWQQAIDAAAGQQPGPQEIAAAVAAHRPRRRRKTRPRPIRLKVPGGIVIIEPRHHDANPAQMLQDAATVYQQKQAA